MKIDFSEKLKAIDSTPLDGGAVDLRTVCIMGLLEEDRQAGGVELVRRHRLAHQILSAAGVLDISVEDASLLKELVARKYPTPLLVGPAWALLNG